MEENNITELLIEFTNNLIEHFIELGFIVHSDFKCTTYMTHLSINKGLKYTNVNIWFKNLFPCVRQGIYFKHSDEIKSTFLELNNPNFIKEIIKHYE